MKNTNIASFKVEYKKLFTYWLIVTKLLHKLTDKEIELLAVLLYKRMELSKDITNEKYLNKVLFDADTKKELEKELDVNNLRIQNILSSLRRKNVVIDNRINPKFIPNIEHNAKNFRIVFNFEIK
jgi:hypothetical protein